MIEEIEFENFRNIKGKYVLNKKLSVIVGKNNSGKTNFLDGIRLAFSAINGEYFKIKKSDFYDSNDSNPIVIKIKLSHNDVPSLNYLNAEGEYECGFIVYVTRTRNGRYERKVKMYNGSDVDYDILRDDPKIPNLYMIPLIRVDDLYTEWLTVGITKFIESEERYSSLMLDSKEKIKDSMSDKITKFKEFCKRFNQDLDVELTEPKITDEKVYIVDGNKEHNYCISSGYKSIANIILNSMDENYSIILMDEIENHLHPSLLRNLIKEIRTMNSATQIITTSHSPIVVNEVLSDEIIDISGIRLSDLSEENRKKIQKFLHPGRCEIVFGENIILVEGITEELLLKDYSNKHQKNWTIVNVAGIMFEPYIELSLLLKKKLVVISDTDILLNDDLTPTNRFKRLEEYCKKNKIKMLSMFNTLESDLFKNNIISSGFLEWLQKAPNAEIYVAKNGKKTLITEKIIESNIDLSDWHIIKEIENEFESH